MVKNTESEPLTMVRLFTTVGTFNCGVITFPELHIRPVVNLTGVNMWFNSKYITQLGKK